MTFQNKHMKANNFISKVIKSMTMNEKRHFKVFCNRHVIGSQNKYVVIFDVIQKNNVYDEDLIKKELNLKGYSDKFIASDLKYLKKIILKSLNDFHSEKTMDIKIKQQLVSIEILFFKGLYEECLQLINKIKKVNLINENQYLMLELLNWEKKCVGYSKGLLKAIEVNNVIETHFDGLKKAKEITDLYYKSYYFKNGLGKIPYENIISEMNIIIESKILKSKEIFDSIRLNVFTNLIHANYFHIIKDENKELLFLKDALHYFDSNEEYKYENPLDYVSIYTRVIEILKNGNSIEFYKELENLKSFNKMLDLQKDVVNERIILFSYQAELEHLLLINKLDNAVTIKNNILEGIQTSKFKIEPFYLIKIYYLIASIDCMNGNFSIGLKSVNKILNEFKLIDRPGIFIRTEFLNIIVHYELKNYDLVLKLISSLERNYKKNFKFSYIENKMVKTINKLSLDPLSVNEKSEFRKLQQKIQNRSKSNSSTILENNYINYVSLKVKSSN